MAVIKTKIPGFTGIRANVMFKNGVGTTNDPHLIDWFKSKGYIVEDNPVVIAKPPVAETQKRVEDMSVEEIRSLLKEKGMGKRIGNSKDKDRLTELAKEVI